MFQTLRTLVRAQAAEAEERLIDANDTMLLAQHLRDAQAEMASAQQATARLMARKDAEQRRIERLTEEIALREGQARSALTGGQEDLAGDLADRIASLEDQRDQARLSATALQERVGQLRDGIERARDRIARLKMDLRDARAAALTRHTARGLERPPGDCALARAEEIAERVRENARFRDTVAAAEVTLAAEVHDDLDGRVEAAGIASRRSARRTEILSRLNPAEGE